MTTFSTAHTLPVQAVDCRCGAIQAWAPEGTTLRCGNCPTVERTLHWSEGLDSWTHRVATGRTHRILFGWACDLLDLSCGCSWGRLRWPSARLWEFIGRVGK